MARALYRTHRSRSLDEVVGQEHITELLKQSLKKGVISHAYLLTGPRGIGKTSVARILAHEINGLPYSDDPHLDIIEIDAASNRRIDDIRDLRDKVWIAPVSAHYKVYIIDEVHMLTTESFNALLKTLEEPPEHAVFILATTEVHKVPATILSRTQRFHFRPVNEEKVTAHLQSIAKKEGFKIDDDALRLIARHGGGSFRDSISLLDQLTASGEPVTISTVESTLGLVATDIMEHLVETILARDTASLLTQLKALNEAGTSPSVVSDQLVRELSTHADVHPHLYALLDQLLSVSRAHNPFIRLTAILVGYTEAGISAPIETPTPARKSVTNVAPAPEATPKTDRTEALKHVTKPVVQTVVASGEFDWNAVLSTAKSRNAPLHSVLSRARIEYVDGVLTLHFVYALHRKKLEQPQYRVQLATLINDIHGFSPEIVVTDGKQLSAEAVAVAAIMGGGEPVNA